jgi:hypothetical protein
VLAPAAPVEAKTSDPATRNPTTPLNRDWAIAVLLLTQRENAPAMNLPENSLEQPKLRKLDPERRFRTG